MKTFVLGAAALGALALISLPATSLAADAAHGKELYKAQCGVCHAAGEGDGDGGIGPNLKGLIGRKVAGDPEFSYSPALTDHKDKWTEQSLATFLEDPQKAAPGTTMPIQVAAPGDRADLVAYLAMVKAAP
jgi:cytochrome c